MKKGLVEQDNYIASLEIKIKIIEQGNDDQKFKKNIEHLKETLSKGVTTS